MKTNLMTLIVGLLLAQTASAATVAGYFVPQSILDTATENLAFITKTAEIDHSDLKVLRARAIKNIEVAINEAKPNQAEVQIMEWKGVFDGLKTAKAFNTENTPQSRKDLHLLATRFLNEAK